MTGVDIAIEANRLYRLTVSQSKQAFNITIADWTDADEEFATVFQPAPQTDIYLCMGQSNMVGWTTSTGADYAAISNAYVYNHTSDSWAVPSNPISAYNVLGDRQDGRIGVHYGFLLDMVNYYPGRKVAIVLAAWGGKPIADFLPGSSTGYYSKAITAVKSAALMSGGTIRGVIWHQGESDSGSSLLSQYEGKLKTLTTALRTDLGIPGLPFVAGEVVQGTSSDASYSAFNAELNRIAGSGSISNLYVVQSDGLTSQDAAHFSVEGITTLGQRYAAMVHSILPSE
jgi:hypothetical protein